jgi:hypothetical protein
MLFVTFFEWNMYIVVFQSHVGVCCQSWHEQHDM